MERKLTPEKAAELLKRAQAKGVQVKPNPLHPTTEFVASSMTQTHVWYRLRLKTDDAGRMHAQCSCKGFQGHGYCSHFVLLAWELRFGTFAPPAVPAAAVAA
jgi:SWIM zinc finger